MDQITDTQKIGHSLMDKGEIIEEAPPETFFSQPRNERTRLFLSQVLGH